MTTKTKAPTTASVIVAAFERAWGDIQKRNHDVPDVFFALGDGSVPFGLILGSFSHDRWTVDKQKGVHEIFIGGEGLQRGPKEVLATMLHEAAHGVAYVRKVQDTSRQGRYHNDRYRQIATEMGIHVERDASIGWSLTSMPGETADEYADTIADLGSVLNAYRNRVGFALLPPMGGSGDKIAKPKDPNAPVKPPTNVACVCECSPPRRIRLAVSTLALGEIRCQVCGTNFERV
jgi:hypothetical protein